MDTIYVETGIRRHPRVQRVVARFPKATLIECDRYGEVFNPRSQNFRLQKKRPALILARKHGAKVLPAPEGYSIGPGRNMYFSHMLNCLYDCRYCFLQGMYSSAHYVFFVNFEDFQREIDDLQTKSKEPVCFFSGYDCDSLAMESLTGFASEFLPFFRDRPNAVLELRTKSANTSVLEKRAPCRNIVAAYTLTPEVIAAEIEHGAPKYSVRLKKIERLAAAGWPIGLRLDPLVPWPGFKQLYTGMIEEVFCRVDPDAIHSVTLGPMRFPKAMYEKILKLYPADPLFTLQEMSPRKGQMAYPRELEAEMVGAVHETLMGFLPESRIFRQS